jgi:hypothetical protein
LVPGEKHIRTFQVSRDTNCKAVTATALPERSRRYLLPPRDVTDMLPDDCGSGEAVFTESILCAGRSIPRAHC